MFSKKKILYLVLWVIASILLAILAAGIIELISYSLVDRLSLTAVLYGTLITQGIILGLMVGPIAWKMIYVDGVRGKKYVEKE
ncbi:MAG: hypothetical protein WC437_00835 [Patescibacteria group bacterium]|nr:hypothetical protein [Patescibacteria group bacterium]